MAVRVLRDDRVYFSPACQFYVLRAGDVIDGDLGKYLEDNYPAGVEVVDAAPAAPAEAEPVTPPAEASVSPPDPKPAPDPDPDPLVSTDPAGGSADDDPAPFEPADHNGPDVIAFARANPEQRAAVLAAERAGKARTTVLTALAD